MSEDEKAMLERFVIAHERQAHALEVIAGILLRDEREEPVANRPQGVRTTDDDPL